MLIDWFTVGAQALNFVILAWLMKRFLYQPILDAIDAREGRIAAESAAADSRLAEARREHDEFLKKNDEFDLQRSALLGQARADADQERQRSMDEARKAADAWVARRRESLASQTQALVQGVCQRAQAEVFAIAGRALADLADASLEESACAVFIDRLKRLEEPQRQALASALKEAGDAVQIRSAFALPPAQRLALQQAIEASFGVHPELRFDEEPHLVAGIELLAQGRKFAWTISDYLESLELEVSALLEVRVGESSGTPIPGAEPSPQQAPVAAALPTGATERAAKPVEVAAAP